MEGTGNLSIQTCDRSDTENTETCDPDEENIRLIGGSKEHEMSGCLSGLRSRIRGLSTNAKSIILAIFALLGHLVTSLVLPLWSSTFTAIGSDAFVGQLVDTVWELLVLSSVYLAWKVFFDRELPLRPTATLKSLVIYGISNALTGVFIVFASLPERTPPYLQSIIGSSLIPFTVICRCIMLRKGVSLRRAVCIIIAMIGLFITMEPRIWGLKGSSGTGSSTGSATVVFTVGRILWPLSFCFGFVPDAVNRVITEQQLKRPQINTVNFLVYAQLSALVSVILLFWADLIPGFGMANSVQDLLSRISLGMRCSISADASCQNLSLKVWMMITAHCVGYLFHFLLIKHAEGAILASLVQAMRTPIASIFWTLYHYNEKLDVLYWSPEFNITTCFLIGGLFIVVPAMLVYNVFSNEEIQSVYMIERELHVPDKENINS
ncbi:crt homolog 1-like [Haliotis cracherodii]|uniref:crt homolog 1-like n=1 Tax=Haliotis cracherodii TaxID=6455 RepID=UPI0039E9FC6C